MFNFMQNKAMLHGYILKQKAYYYSNIPSLVVTVKLKMNSSYHLWKSVNFYKYFCLYNSISVVCTIKSYLCSYCKFVEFLRQWNVALPSQSSQFFQTSILANLMATVSKPKNSLIVKLVVSNDSVLTYC